MSRQLKSGRCTCWAECNKKLLDEGTTLSTVFTFSGKEYLEIVPERTDGKRKKPKRIVCSFCPFCGKKLK
jgi:hypothetical protein